MVASTLAVAPPAPPAPPASGWRRALPWLRKAGIALFFLLVAGLIGWQAQRIEWGEVLQAARGYGAPTLLAAALLAICSHAIYSTYDLIGRHYVAHRLPAWQVMRVAFISYAFNLNFGTLIGAVGMRARLYSRLGLTKADVARIVALSVVTNWSGYLCLAGVAFASGAVDAPDNWHLGAGALRVIGYGLLAAIALYLLACRFGADRSWHVRGHEITLPGLRLALLQLAISMANWATMAAVVTVLLWPLAEQPPGYGAVLVTLLIACIAGVLAKVPAGLGVLEAVFIAMLGHRMSEHALLAGLLTYRALYYLLPLAIAGISYALLEWKARRSG